MYLNGYFIIDTKREIIGSKNLCFKILNIVLVIEKTATTSITEIGCSLQPIWMWIGILFYKLVEICSSGRWTLLTIWWIIYVENNLGWLKNRTMTWYIKIDKNYEYISDILQWPAVAKDWFLAIDYTKIYWVD